MITLNNKAYRELRCSKCRKFILYEYIFAGRVAYQCPRCGEFNEFNFKHMNTKESNDLIKKEYSIEGDKNA